MDGHGHGHHAFQAGGGYTVDDDLMNNAGWPASTDQYAFPDQQPQQDQYSQYPASQPAFDHFDLTHQPTYQQEPYSQSPYASQYQHARPSDVFGGNSYNFDNHAPSLPRSNAYPGNHAFSYGPPASTTTTVAPQSLHFSMGLSQSLDGISHSGYQQPLNGVENVPSGYHQFSQRPTQEPNVRYFVDPRSSGQQQQQQQQPQPQPQLQLQPQLQPQPQPQPHPQPQLQLQPQPQPQSQPQPQPQPKPQLQPQPQPQPQPASTIRHVESPASTQNVQIPETSGRSYGTPVQQQNPLRVTHPELLVAVENSPRRRIKQAPYLAVGEAPMQIPSSEKDKLKNTIPKYHPRKSISGKPLVPGLDISRTSSTPRISATKKVKLPKPAKAPHVPKWKGTSQAGKQASGAVARIRGEEGDVNPSIKSPSTSTEPSSSEDESSSEEESDYEEEERIVTLIESVRDPTRPTDVAAAAGWDAIGIIWKDPGSSPSSDVVKEAIQKYGDFVSSLRLQLKANAEEIKAANSRPADLENLKKARMVQVDALFETIDAANKLGYMAIVENLGGHHKLVNGLTATLIECIKTEDFLGKLPRAIFSLLAKFQTMSDELLKKVKFDSIQKRWSKKGDDSIKKDITAILANTTDAKEKSAKEKKETSKVDEKKKFQAPQDQNKLRNGESSKAASTPSSAKRPYDGDGTNGQPNKKIASDGSGTSTKSVPLKRPTNLLANNLLGQKPVAKPIPKKRDPSPPPVSRLAGFLAEIENPREPLKAPEPPPGPPETPEEKEKRERRESRRHLRVKFKEGPELEQIRLFTKEQAEDEGRQDAMLRDAHDAHSEGMMLKKGTSENMEGIEEDDEQPSGDIEYRPYPRLIDIDLRGLGKEVLDRNLITRGGFKTFSTPEQQAQDRREELELMVVYTDIKDIPTSPKEPHTILPVEDLRELRYLGNPNESWLVQRLQDLQRYGPEYAAQIFTGRLDEQKLKNIRDNRARGSNHLLSSISSVDGSSTHNIMSSHHNLAPTQGGTSADSSGQHQINPLVTKSQDDPAIVAAYFDNLNNVVQYLKGKPYPAIEPPDWMTNERDRAIWWEGYNRDKAKKEADERVAQLQAARTQPASMVPTQYPMPTPQMQGYPSLPNHISPDPYQTPDVTRHVQSILADLNNGQAGGNGAVPPFDYHAWASGNINGNGQRQGYGEEDNQQPRWDGGWDGEKRRVDEDQDNSNKRPKNRGSEMKQVGVPENDAAVKAYKGKKKPCRFFQEGKCAKGAKCTFLHE